MNTPKVKMETSKSFTVLFWTWSITGTKPLKPYKFFRLLHIIICWILLSLSPVFLSFGCIKAMETSSTTVVLTILQATVNVASLPLKAIVAALNLKQLRDVQLIFADLDQHYVRPEEQRRIADCVKICRRLSFTYFILFAMYGCMSWLVPLLTNKQQYAWYPIIDWIPGPNARYWAHTVFEAFFIHFLQQVNLPNDTYSAIYIQAIRTHIQLLAGRVRRVGNNPDFNEDQNFKELVDCIASHQKLFKIVDIVGSVVSLTTFMQLAVVAAVLCICMLNIFIYADGSYKAVTVVYYLCVWLQTLPTCYQASMLEVDCANLHTAIFQCNWLALDRRARKMLILFMHRAKEEISFTAIKMFKINLGTILSIAKFSFTLYTFINEMGFGNNLKEKVE